MGSPRESALTREHRGATVLPEREAPNCLSCCKVECGQDVTSGLLERAEEEDGNELDQELIQKLTVADVWAMNPVLYKSLSYCVRVAFMMALAKGLSWTHLMPPVWTDAKHLPTLVTPMVLTSLDNLGTTMKLTFYSTMGVFLAILNAHLMSFIPYQEGNIIAIVDFFVFAVFVLTLNTHLNVKVFALIWASTTGMFFANPDLDLVAELDITNNEAQSLNGLFAMHVIGCSFAILAMIFPFPVTALSHGRQMACITAKEIAFLLTAVSKYYTGSDKSFKINVWASEFNSVAEDSAKLQDAVGIVWWEGFDCCKFGPQRVMLSKQLFSLQKLVRRLSAIQDCATREQFEKEHVSIMTDGLDRAIVILATRMGNLMMWTTVCAVDGSLDGGERLHVQKHIDGVKCAMEELARVWRLVLKRNELSGLELAVRTESFFVSELTRVAYSMIRFSTNVMAPPEKAELGIKQKLSSLFDFKGRLKNDRSRSFVLRNSLSLTLSFAFGCYYCDFDNVTSVNVALMLTTTVGGALPLGLKRVQGTVLGLIVGKMMGQFLRISDWVPLKCSVLFFYELIPLFIRHFSDEHRIVGTLLAIFGGKQLMIKHSQLPTDEAARETAIQMQDIIAYHQIYMLAIGLGITTLIDMAMNRQPSDKMAVEALIDSVDQSFTAFVEFLEGDSSKMVEEMDSQQFLRLGEAKLEQAKVLASEAQNEPRCAAKGFPIRLFLVLVDKVREASAKMQSVKLAFVFDGDKELFDHVTSRPSWPEVRQQIVDNVEQVKAVIRVALLESNFNTFDVDFKNHELTGLENLVKEVEDYLKTPGELAKTEAAGEGVSLEADRINRLAAIFETLDLVHGNLNCITEMTLESL